MAEIHITKRMDSLIDDWQRREDRRVDFLRCYRLMTGNMLLGLHPFDLLRVSLNEVKNLHAQLLALSV